MSKYERRPNEVKVKSLKMGDTETGGTYTNFSVDPEEFATLVGIAQEVQTEGGVRLALFTREAKAKDGTPFLAGTLLVEGVKPRASGGQRRGSFVPKRAGSSDQASSVLNSKSIKS